MRLFGGALDQDLCVVWLFTDDSEQVSEFLIVSFDFLARQCVDILCFFFLGNCLDLLHALYFRANRKESINVWWCWHASTIYKLSVFGSFVQFKSVVDPYDILKSCRSAFCTRILSSSQFSWNWQNASLSIGLTINLGRVSEFLKVQDFNAQ